MPAGPAWLGGDAGAVGILGGCAGSASPTEEWEGRMLPLGWGQQGQGPGICLGGCCLLGELPEGITGSN